MRLTARTLLASVLLCGVAATSEAEVLIRWTVADVPTPQTLGVPALVVPDGNRTTARAAITQGYRVYLEVDAAALATFTPPTGSAGVVVRGKAAAVQLTALRQRLHRMNARVLTLDERGKWPHIRSNWVTKNNDVLQVAGRSAQPWIENNAALVRIASTAVPAGTPLLTYTWTPATVADAQEGPRLEDYLVAIAEAGSLGADLLLPVHERFQQSLLLGHPQARRDWSDIKRYVEFYAENIAARYQPLADVGVVTETPMVWFEVMNLLARHNVAFQLIAPAHLAARKGPPLKFLIVLDELDQVQAKAAAELELSGTTVRNVKQVADPNKFALEIRQLLGRGNRTVDVWNGITILSAPYKQPGGANVLVMVTNYAHQPLPVQIRIVGTFSEVHYESPEEAAALLPHEHRDGHTEFVVPALRVGGRIFLTNRP